MIKFIIILIQIYSMIFSSLLWAVPKEQDRAILEGGERNLLTNPGFEARKAGVTASGGVVALETADPLDGKISLTWDSSADEQTLESALFAIPKGMQGATCGIFVKYLWEAGVANDLKLVAHDGTDPIAEIDLNPTSGVRIVAGINFTCPSSGSLKWRIESTVSNPAIITLDARFLGSGRNSQFSANAELIAHAFYADTTNCIWQATSTGFATFGTDTDCPSITVGSGTGTVNTADNDLPDIVFNSLKPGHYIVHTNFTGRNATASQGMHYRIFDQTASVNIGGDCGDQQGTDLSQSINVKCMGSFTLTTTGPKTLIMQAGSTSGTIEIRNDINGRQLTWIITRMPLAAAESITLETIGQYWDVNIGGGNPDLGTADKTIYTSIENGALDMVINSGSASAEIGCASGTAPSGLTCSAADESVSVAMSIQKVGTYYACFEFSHAITNTAGGDIAAIFQIIETPLAAVTILKEGNSRVQSRMKPVDIDNSSAAIHVCGVFNFVSVGKKLLRLMYEQSGGGGSTTNLVIGDRNGLNGQRDIHFVMFELTQSFPTPAFTDLTSSLSRRWTTVTGSVTGDKVMTAADIRCSGASSLIDQDTGAWLASISNISAGNCLLTMNAGVFANATKIVCNVNDAESSNPVNFLSVHSFSGDTFRIDCDADGGADCTTFFAHLSCKGVK